MSQSMSDRTDRATARPTRGANTNAPSMRPWRRTAIPLDELEAAFADWTAGVAKARAAYERAKPTGEPGPTDYERRTAASEASRRCRARKKEQQ